MAEVQFVPADDTQGVHSLTCISCRLMFTTTKDQRNHYQTDLHRFNLKRKVAELPPVSIEVYEQKVKNTQNQDTPKQRGPNKDRTSSADSYVCQICDKYYNSPNAHAQHLKSKKHIEKASKQDTQPLDTKPKQTEKVEIQSTPKEVQIAKESSAPSQKTASMETEQDEEKIIEERLKNARKLLLEECLFCLFKSADLQSNLHHMTHSHGFFIPDLEYLSDLEGLISYLGDKISVGLTCLHCNGKGRSFWSLEGVQTHMKDMSHCKLAYEENEDEYEDFYDFSTDYSSTPGQIVAYNDETANLRISENGNELIFGSGKVVGHRSLNTFYKQKYHTSKSTAIINNLAGEYKLLGWNNSTQKKTTLSPVPKVELRKQAWYQMKVSFQKNNQKHFKDSTKLL